MYSRLFQNTDIQEDNRKDCVDSQISKKGKRKKMTHVDKFL